MRAGALSAELRGADLTCVRWGGLEIASAIQVTVRDERWGSVPSTVRRAEVSEDPGGFTISLEAVHGGSDLVWRGAVRAAADGSLEFEMEGVAERDFVYRRIGICVLHPWAPYVGARYEASGAGNRTGGSFPPEIAPQLRVGGAYQPLIPAFDRLQVAFPGGAEAVFSFEGEDDGFELEDQRNWTDASFKTYPTPLGRSAPRTIHRGERLRQRLRLEVRGSPTESAPDAGPVVVRVGGPSGRAMPDVGLSAPSTPVDPARLGALDPAHLRTAAGVPGPLDGLRGAASLARASDIPLEVALLLGDEEDRGRELGAIGGILAGAPVARVMILHGSGETSNGDLVAHVGTRLGLEGVPLVGGTASHFSELNRSVPDPDGMDAVGLAMSPQVHVADERSMVETLEIQAQIVERVRALANGAPVVISPVSLAAHATLDQDELIDERVGTAFGAAWTVGSVASLASAGVASVTLHERAERTVLASDDLTRAFRLLTARRGRALRDIRSSHQRRAVGIGVSGAAPILVNLTPDPLEVLLEGDVSGAVDLAPYEVAEVDRSPR